ncbi:hypothetical protein AB0299_08575 [Pseudarthrobacter sp. NPDC080037]|uniref:Uncharacterized protein n=1 Tax=Pseudarthrobacter enclensis TaxID=993070 RepID=A0ABT9RQ96_9MICC|nr:hypothetical protein [Pseudarthrobacter enclensis]
MMTLTGEWNAVINAFPAFADSARAARMDSVSCRTAVHPDVLWRR